MTGNELELRISLVLPDAARPTLTAYRDEHPDLDATTLDLVDELLTHGRTTIHPRWNTGETPAPVEQSVKPAPTCGDALFHRLGPDG